MGCFGRFLSLLGAIALLWTCGGIFYAFIGSQYAARLGLYFGYSNDSTLATLGFFLITGIPAIVVFAALANIAKRNHQQQISQPIANLRPQFEAAKALIQVKKYDEARALLRTINHPTAQEWLRKLDNITGVQPKDDLSDLI